MQPLAQPSSQTTEDSGKGKRRRRGWLIVTFSVLACLLILLIALVSDPGAPKHRFLKLARLVDVQEAIFILGHRGPVLGRSADYETNLLVNDLAATIKLELPVGEWTEINSSDDSIYFTHRQSDDSIYVYRGQSVTVIEVREIRPPSAIDQFRIWCKSFGKPKAQQIDIGGPMLRRP